MKDKIKIIFVPTLLTMLGLVTIYTFLHWALFIELDIFPLKEIVRTFGAPIVLAGVFAFLILRPRLKILKLEAKRGNWRNFYCFILWVVLMVPLFIAQEYIITASGKLTALNSIHEIQEAKPSKYYSLKEYFIDKEHIGVYSAFEVSGKYNSNFNMHIYVAMPILRSAADTSQSTCFAWLGVKYSKTISNSLEAEQKEKVYQEFARQSQLDFDALEASGFVYLDRIGLSDERDGFIEAIKENSSYEPGETILLPVREPFEARNGETLPWIFRSASIGLAVWLVMLSIPRADTDQLNRIKQGKPDRAAKGEMKEMMELVIPREGFYIAPLLMYANVGVFIVMSISGLGFMSFNADDLLRWGANYGPLTQAGEWWRLLTSTFLHAGFMHLFANMYGLLFVSLFLEPIVGKNKFLAVYLFTGVIGSVASMSWYDATVSVGASGAIFGLYGLAVALMLTKVFPPAMSKALWLSILIFVGYSLSMGLAGEGIDNAAHVGGLVSGFVAGLFLSRGLREKEMQRITEEEESVMQDDVRI